MGFEKMGVSSDAIEIEITENGEIVMRVNGSITPTNHMSADELISEVQRLAGGEVKKTKLKRTHTHAHAHAHAHNRAR